MQQLPIGLPDSNPRHPGKLKRSGRVETGPERAEREATAERRQAQAQAPKLPIIAPRLLPEASTLRPTTPLAPKRSYEDIRSPEAPPTPARSAPRAPTPPSIVPRAPTVSQESLVDPFEPPPSTAPAAVGRRSGRANQGRGWEGLVPKGRGRGKP
jgi:hypothetical protein